MTDESDPRVERVARALCQADGKPPDGEHETHEYKATRIGAAHQYGPKRIPNWTGYGYVKEATRFAAAVDALNKNS
jgi:hypothetical protein